MIRVLQASSSVAREHMTNPDLGATTSAEQPWPAPYAAHPVDAVVSLPGSKSMTNRALVLSALATGPSTIHRPLLARDTQLMIQALQGLGVRIERHVESLTVTPEGLHGPATVQCGLAGTILRFVPPVSALASGRTAFVGDEQAARRPVAELLAALRTLGVTVEAAARSLPFWVEGTGRVRGGAATLDASASSQFVSALLLAGSRFDDGVDLQHRGQPVPSQPHIDMTVAMLAERGVAVLRSAPDHWAVEPGPIAPVTIDVEPDLSTAAPFLAAAVVTAGRVTVSSWPRSTYQPGHRLAAILGSFGADVSWRDGELTVTGPGRIAGVDLDLQEIGELTPVVAAVAALATAPSYLRGIGHLRGHETNRLVALATELSRLGAEVSELPDGLRIRPRRLHGAVVQTYGDHRLAQAAAVLGLAVRNVEIVDVATTTKTHPDFVSAWTELVA